MSSDNPRGRQAVEISVVFTVIAACIVALRLYARFFVVRCAGLEDYGIVLAMVEHVLLYIAQHTDIEIALFYRPNDSNLIPQVHVLRIGKHS
jgi:hypothetical protein